MGEGEGREVRGDLQRPLAKPRLVGEPTRIEHRTWPVWDEIGADDGRGQGGEARIGGPSRQEIGEQESCLVGVEQRGEVLPCRVDGARPAVAGAAERKEHCGGQHGCSVEPLRATRR
jgi:hypothetical protein